LGHQPVSAHIENLQGNGAWSVEYSLDCSSKADKVSERIFMDISGPFNPSIGGSTYWVLVVDDLSRMGFVHS